jgi:hypothetical protein
MVLVLAVMLLATAIAYPYLDALRDDINMTAGADKVRAAWAEARLRAIEDSQPYKFGIVPGQNGFRVTPDNGDASAAPALEGTLPKGITFSLDRSDLGSDGDGYVTLVTFQPNGSASDDVQITLTASGTRPVTLGLRSLTGAVSVRRGD